MSRAIILSVCKRRARLRRGLNSAMPLPRTPTEGWPAASCAAATAIAPSSSTCRAMLGNPNTTISPRTRIATPVRSVSAAPRRHSASLFCLDAHLRFVRQAPFASLCCSWMSSNRGSRQAFLEETGSVVAVLRHSHRGASRFPIGAHGRGDRRCQGERLSTGDGQAQARRAEAARRGAGAGRRAGHRARNAAIRQINEALLETQQSMIFAIPLQSATK